MAEVTIARNKCKGCKLCVFYCPTKHLEMSQDLNARGVRYASVKKGTRCTGCGFCFLICPDACVEVYEKSACHEQEQKNRK